MKILRIILGIINILAGLIMAAIFILLQGIMTFTIGFIYIIFGVTLFMKRYSFKLLFYGVVPATVLFFTNIIMLGIDKNIPEYYQTPFWLVAILVMVFSVICIVNTWFLIKTKSGEKSSNK